MNITITCDRCGKIVDGYIEQIPELGTVTDGYFIVSHGPWKEYGRWEEEKICEDCMFDDPKFQTRKQ